MGGQGWVGGGGGRVWGYKGYHKGMGDYIRLILDSLRGIWPSHFTANAHLGNERFELTFSTLALFKHSLLLNFFFKMYLLN